MSPESLTSRGRKEQYDKLDDYSDAADDRRREFRRKSVADMKASFDYDALDADGKTSYDIWLELPCARWMAEVGSSVSRV